MSYAKIKANVKIKSLNLTGHVGTFFFFFNHTKAQIETVQGSASLSYEEPYTLDFEAHVVFVTSTLLL